MREQERSSSHKGNRAAGANTNHEKNSRQANKHQGKNQDQNKNQKQAKNQSSGGLSAAQIEKYIKGIEFPCEKNDLIQQARDNNAPEDVLEAMDSFPDQEYNSPVDIARSIGEIKH